MRIPPPDGNLLRLAWAIAAVRAVLAAGAFAAAVRTAFAAILGAAASFSAASASARGRRGVRAAEEQAGNNGQGTEQLSKHLKTHFRVDV